MDDIKDLDLEDNPQDNKSDVDFNHLDDLNLDLNQTNQDQNKDTQNEENEENENQAMTDLKSNLTKLKNDFDSLNDRYLRCLAEYDNFRKRSSKEKSQMFCDGEILVVKYLLDIIDNFERALKVETKDNDFKKGIEMIFNQFLDVFQKLGVEEINTQNNKFDPSVHNAVMHIEDEKYGPSEIVETLQKGYKLGESIIRYSMVKVAN